MPDVAQQVAEEFEEPDVSHLITEDDEPVDNPFSEKQQRLLVVVFPRRRRTAVLCWENFEALDY